MKESFSFSPNPNRAAEIAWRPWGRAALAAAAAADRPIVFNLSAGWCRWCHRMDETTYSDPAIIALVNEAFVGVRVDADRYPHVQERYIAGGWPTNAFLTPTGEVLWAGTLVEPEQFRQVAESVLAAWRERRPELDREIERRRRALDAARGRNVPAGLVRREAADDVLMALRETFDARNGGFGEAPKFPQPEAVALLYAQAREDPTAASLADQTLDGLLAGELWDAAEGGFFRYATAADWTRPQYEKLLETNAGLLSIFGQAAALRGRDDWSQIARRTVAWAEGALRLESGLYGGSLSADAEYYAAADAASRRGRRRPRLDSTLYTSANARWLGALALTGARLGEAGWVQQADTALHALLTAMAAPGGGLYHYAAADGEPSLDHLLVDTLECARAALALAQATGSGEWLRQAIRLSRHMEASYWSPGGGFWDRIPTDDDVGALRYLNRSFEQNAAAAGLLLELAQVTGDRSWRALAERTLSRIAAQAGRFGAEGAACGLAVEAFFEAPPAVFIAVADGGERHAAELRSAAFRLPVPELRVWTVPAGHAAGPQQFAVAAGAAAFVRTAGGCSPPITAADALVSAGAVLS